MRGIPKNIATRQDVFNLCNDLPPEKARQVMEKHKEFLKKGEYQDLKKAITAQKRKETLAKKRAKRQWARLRELEANIPDIKDQIDILMAKIRCLTKTQNKAIAEKKEIELLIEYGRT